MCKIRNPQSEINGIKNAVYGFHVAKYDKRYPLIIDPTLAYSTYLGEVIIIKAMESPWMPTGMRMSRVILIQPTFPRKMPYREAVGMRCL
ncbi:MAG: hypothetical protein U0586_09380 [Candidatus Brocadiaceae bacterium]